MVVSEQADEVERIIQASQELGAAPFIGIRAKLSSRSTGRWGSSVGAKAKFGLAIPELLATVEALKKANLLNDLKLLHFHVGSQINDIAVLKDALQEAGQIYVELTKLGAPMGFLDVGGGLGVDYDGSRTATSASTNYSPEDANDVVATVRECCEPHAVPVPTLVSESGRAIASHFSVLVFNVLGQSTVPSGCPAAEGEEALTVRNLRHTLAEIEAVDGQGDRDLSKLQETWNDALKFKDDALNAFRLGYLSLPERSVAEQLTWACAQAIAQKLPSNEAIPEELSNLKAELAATFYANLSVFRSAPDSWAIEQLFPLLPIHRLNEQPEQLGHFSSLTCDSDGKLARFIAQGQANRCSSSMASIQVNLLDRPVLRAYQGDGQPPNRLAPPMRSTSAFHPAAATRWTTSFGVTPTPKSSKRWNTIRRSCWSACASPVRRPSKREASKSRRQGA